MLTGLERRAASYLRDLDPVDRALLDLSIRRGVRDEMIADLLRVKPLLVKHRRTVLVERLAQDLELRGWGQHAELRALLAGLPARHWQVGPELRQPGRRARPRRARTAVIAAGLTLGAGTAGALIGVLSREGDEPRGSRPATAGPDQSRGGAVRLDPVTPRVGGRGTARLVGRGTGARLELSVTGLPPLEEAYEVWLYDSVSRAVRLGRFVRGRFAVATRLPVDPARYRAVDVSREPLDDNPNHSGESVLRVSVARLLEAQRH